MGKKEEKEKIEKLEEIPRNQELLVIATGKYIGEGFDYARLDTMFLTMPISWKGTLQQYIGRIHRLYEGKEIVKVYDYVDDRVEMLNNMYKKRKNGYQTLGYNLQNSESENDDNTEQMKLF
ncbi:hypothetical protein SAMN05216389_10561 [Oceanobacillus limi]|uniref:Helicase conserved C-terminal domain-containing protein n=1 Tax=Oceanobacillus limi TaxID=930131 RepID=A0A1I0BM16_9BACI|nr:hypothetical protein [Oceanobacillus limi]SET07329.1 hypothetical protein SAMN05216389_10561 [Oceanobacillus limi]